MADLKPKTLKTSKALQTFVKDVTDKLLAGDRFLAPGLGTFSTCSRKATTDRAACRMAMFRASSELRAYASGGPKPNLVGPDAKIIGTIIEAMRKTDSEGVNIPSLGRMAVVPVSGKQPKLIFHGSDELNDALSTE